MSHHTDILEAIAGISRLATELLECNAIWLDWSLKMPHKCSRRIVRGDQVSVRKDYLCGARLVDCNEYHGPTHEITGLRANLYNTMFEVKVKSLEDGEEVIIKL